MEYVFAVFPAALSCTRGSAADVV